MKAQTRFYEELAMNSHPALHTMLYDGWVLRFSDGYTRRANCVCPIYPAHLELSEKVPVCEEYYRKLGLPCIFKLTDDNDSAVDAFLEARGYLYSAPTDVMVMDISNRPFSAADSVITDHPDSAWLDTFFRLEKYTDTAAQTAAKRLFDTIQGEALYCRIVSGGISVACASAVIERGFMALGNVIVDEAFRGKGFGRKLCESLLAKAAVHGSHTAHLQVMQGNTAAIRLYGSLGYRRLYSYHYRVKE